MITPANSTAPTAQLVREHDHILTLLQVLERLAELAEGPTPPLAAIAQAIEIVRLYADALHHGKEEQLLFPKLEELGIPREGGPIGCMLREHEEGRDAVDAMAAGLDALKTGGAGGVFAAAAVGYVGLLRGHIDKENQVLFPMAEQLLGDDDKAELLAAFAGVEEHDVGASEVARLEAALSALTTEYLGASV